MVIIYNRVFKIVSIFFINIVYDLCVKNKYYVFYINIIKNNLVMFL